MLLKEPFEGAEKEQPVAHASYNLPKQRKWELGNGGRVRHPAPAVPHVINLRRVSEVV